MASFEWPTSGGGGGGVPIYSTFGAFPAGSTSGDLAVAADTGILYEWSGSAWREIAAPGSAFSLGNLDAQSGTAKGAALVGGVLSMQSASATEPGLVNTSDQTFTGQKEFLSPSAASTPLAIMAASGQSGQLITINNEFGATITYFDRLGAMHTVGDITANGMRINGLDYPNTIFNAGNPISITTTAGNGIDIDSSGNVIITGTVAASNLSGTNTGDVTLGTAHGLSLSGQALSLALSSTSTTGALSNTDWNTFNGKGSVSSVALTVPSVLSISGSPVTTSGTLAIGYSGTALPPANGGTGTTTAFTQNSIVFAGASGNYTQNAANFSYDPSVGEHGRMTINAQDQSGVSASPTNAVLNVYCASGDQGIAITSGSSNDPLLVQNGGLAPTATLITAGGSSSTTGASLIGAHCRGTLVSKTQTQAGDLLFSITSQGYSGSGFGPGVSGSIAFIATQNATASVSGGEVLIASTPNGTQTPIPGLIVGQDQKLQLPVYTTAGVLTNDTSGNVVTTAVLPIAKGGTNNGSLAVTAGGVTYTDGSKLVNVGAGTSGQFLKSNAASAPTWASPSGILPISVVKTSTYAILTTDVVVQVDPSGGPFTITLPTAVGVSGQVYYLISTTDGTSTNFVTIATTSAQTIAGVTTKTLASKGEAWTIISDGANWQVLGHKASFPLSAYTPTFTGFGTVGTTLVTGCRSGVYLKLMGSTTTGTVTAVNATFTIPTGLSTVSSSFIFSTQTVVGSAFTNAAANAMWSILAAPSDTKLSFGLQNSGQNGWSPVLGTNGFTNGEIVSWTAEVPILGWSD